MWMSVFRSSSRAVATLSIVASLALVTANDAFGHGGGYRGPGGGFPGAGTGGGGPPTGGPPIPGGGGPTTGGGGGPNTLTATKKTPTQSYTDFGTWWEFNKHRYLNLRARLRSRTALTGNSARTKDLSGRPSFEELQGDVLDGILRLSRDPDADIADSAVLALARITPSENAAMVDDAIHAALSRKEQSVRHAAILSLGVLGGSDGVPKLLGILGDTPEGRRTLELNERIATHARGLAAVALGLIGDLRAIDPLLAAFRDDRGGDDELRASVVLALGLFRDPPHEATEFLITTLEDGKYSDRVRAQVPVALARGHDASKPALPRLLKLLQGKKTPNYVRQSAAIAVGELAGPSDGEAIQELLDVAEAATDDGSSNFAFLALGSLAGRAAVDLEVNREVVKSIQRALLKGLLRPRERTQVPWAAMSLALLGKELKRDSGEREEIESRLADAFGEAKSNDHRAAIALALGLLEAERAAKELLDAFERTNDNEYSSALAEALGLMRHEPAAKAMKVRLEKISDPKVRARIAIGLGLMGDLEVTGMLLKELATVSTLYGTASIAKSLGIVGDRSAIKPLTDLAHGKSKVSLVQAFAVVALGLLGEKTPLPWNARIAENANYLAAFAVQQEILDIL